MKTISIKIVTLLLVLTAFACKDDTATDTTLVANDEAADMISASLSSNGGLATALADVSTNTQANGSGRVDACGYAETKNVTKASATGAAITYSFALQYTYALTCTVGVPTTMSANMTYTGSYSGPRLSSQSTGTGSLTVKTLDATFNYFTVNGTYVRTGTTTSKVRNQNTSTSVLTLTLTDVTVDKSTKTITGGSATLTITGTVTGKGDFSFTGNIAFKGNKLSEVTINGTKYSVNLETGDVVAL